MEKVSDLIKHSKGITGDPTSISYTTALTLSALVASTARPTGIISTCST